MSSLDKSKINTIMRGTKECMENVAYYVELLRTKAGIIIPMPRISFELRGTVAGRACYLENKIKFNPILLDENPEVFIKQTVGHEVAHFGTFAKYGRVDPHGSQWRAVMFALGLPGKRCHSYDTATVRGQSHKSLASRPQR